ncbi:MAG: cobyrinate a,c-diamide synthase [Gammaproteobacteria bacterium]|nr:cobyrinate a,c-diamide synthase [Gammaproteobacteria bacterium]
MARLFISAAHKSSGKTTLTIGLCAALAARGLRVAPFKKGPDYIDPMWLSRAAQRPCYNLDFHTMGTKEIESSFAQHSQDADLALIEGNKGLYDGLDLDGSNSNAALAKQLNSPVILVIDARGMTRGIAPLILGYQQFDRNIQIAGIILNQLGGHRHEQKLRAVIEHYTAVNVLGAIQHDDKLAILERHLGLIPSNEAHAVDKKIAQLGQTIADQTDLDALLRIAKAAGNFGVTPCPPPSIQPTVRIGIARDAAFGFYYNDDLTALQQAGAELVFFDTLQDPQLPAVHGLFIGGGFPETQMAGLEANHSMRYSIQQAIEQGLPAYAECGGLMYLARRLQWGRQSHAMVGIIPGDIVMHDKPQGRGYVMLQETGHAPWRPRSQPLSSPIAAHEFHYSSIENLSTHTQFAFKVVRGRGVDGQHDGIVYKNLLACYTHLRHTQQSPWATQFVEFIQRYHRPHVQVKNS